MSKSNETTAKFKVDISDLKKGMQEASRQIRLANSEFKAATSGMDAWNKCADGISAKSIQLNSVFTAQKEQLKILEKQYELTAQEQGENSKAAQELLIRINNQKAAVADTEKQIRSYTSTLGDMQKLSSETVQEQEKIKTAAESLIDTIKNQEYSLGQLKEKYRNIAIEQGKDSDEARGLAEQIDKLSAGLSENKSKLNEAEYATDDFGETLEDTANGSVSFFTVAVGNLVSNVITAGIGKLKDFTSESIAVGKEIDSSMSNVAALSKASSDELGMLRNTAKQYGSETKFSATQAADALSYMALAGWNAVQSANALGGVLDLAAASNMDLAKASDITTDYMSAFNMEAEQSAYFADILAYAQSNSNTSAEQLGDAYKNCAANMNAAGQDIETTTSLLSIMANQGLKGSEAGTALTAAMRDLTAKMKNGAVEIGTASVQVMDANGNFRDMTDILRDVESATAGMGDAERSAALSATFTSDSIKGLNLILNAGVDEAASFEEELRNSTGSAAEMAKIMQDNLGGDLTNFSSKLEGVQIALYEKFEPALRSGVEILNKLLDAVNFVIVHSDEFSTSIIAMSVALGTYLAYTTAIKVMTDGWAALTVVTKAQTAAQAALNVVMNLNPIGLIIAGIAGLTAAFAILWKTSDDFRNFWIDLWQSITVFFSETKNKITEDAVSTWAEIEAIWNIAPEWFRNSITEPVASFFFGMWSELKNGASDAWAGIKSVFGGTAEWFEEKFSTAWQKVKDVFSTGGAVFDGIKEGIADTFKDNVNAIIRGINRVVAIPFNAINDTLNRLRNINIAGSMPFSGIISEFVVPEIPELARGGVLRKGKIGFLEGNGDEAVVPLDENTDWLDEVASRLYNKINLSGSAVPSTSNVTNNFYQTNNSPKSLSRLEIYRQSKNLLRMRGV